MLSARSGGFRGPPAPEYGTFVCGGLALGTPGLQPDPPALLFSAAEVSSFPSRSLAADGVLEV